MGFSSYRYLPLLVSVFHLLIIFASSFPCHDHEKLALLQFKQSFLIDCSSSDQNFAYPKVKSWLNSNCCKWDGVECDKETFHVIELDLSNSCLYGTFPSNTTLFNLVHLQKLNLAGNNFNSSHIPFSIDHLYKLTSLNLSQSHFVGQIPSQVSQLSRLTLLDLSSDVDSQFNLQFGDLSFEKLVRNLTRLTQLYLNRVDISSNVPTFLGNLTSLRDISLASCNLQGGFPTSVFLLPNLQTVILTSNNDLRGQLPKSFGSNSPLRKLRVSLTSFSGELPYSIGKLENLEDLNLWGCYFYGEIPPSLGNLTKLVSLVIRYNDFVGDIPFSITNLTQLQNLDIGYLNVEIGELIPRLLMMNKLTFLGLGGLNLEGEIPCFANLTRLTSLDLTTNHLVGSLPYWFANLTQLTNLYLANNHLQGPIPQWFSHLPNLERLNLSYNGLFGGVDSLLKLENLKSLDLSALNLTFPSNKDQSINSSHSKLYFLGLDSCNLAEFPRFIRNQDQLQFLSLGGNKIEGRIPQWFVTVTQDSLVSIDLSSNYLTGFEQPSEVLPWSYMEELDLSGNMLEGTLPIPSNSIEIYQISDNQLTGVIPKQICEVGSLILLDLSNNKMSGRIPDCIGDRSLLALNLRGNNFHGSIPETSFTKSSCKLKMINLGENQLNGNLPRSLANCKMLEVLDIGRNLINDTFPSWLGSLSKLQVLVLRHNNFHGRIKSSPKPGLDFPALRIIDLSYNFHTGNLPSGYLKKWHAMEVLDENQSGSSNVEVTSYIEGPNIGVELDYDYSYSITITNKGSETFYPKFLNVFKVIDFSSNKFTGKIPAIVGNLKGLQALNLSNNNLDGDFPLSLANIIDLQSLDLSRNKLSGEIPQELSKLTSLEVFNVSYNHLVGPIPEGQQFNTFDNSSYYGNLGLCGVMLVKKCGNSDSMQPLLLATDDDDESDQEDSNLIDWIVRCLGYISGLIVGFVIGKIYITDRHHEWFMETFGSMNKKTKRRMRRRSRHRS